MGRWASMAVRSWRRTSRIEEKPNDQVPMTNDGERSIGHWNLVIAHLLLGRRQDLQRYFFHKVLHLGPVFHHMRRNQMRLQGWQALPFFNHHNDIVARR